MSEKESTTFKAGNRKYIYAVGRRKSAIAQVRLYQKGSGQVIVNDRPLEDYFPTGTLQQAALAPLMEMNLLDSHDMTVKVVGGGVKGQADAVKLGVARALNLEDEGHRPLMKKAGFLTRDARVKERKKFGLRGARRAPQWSKR